MKELITNTDEMVGRTIEKVVPINDGTTLVFFFTDNTIIAINTELVGECYELLDPEEEYQAGLITKEQLDSAIAEEDALELKEVEEAEMMELARLKAKYEGD